MSGNIFIDMETSILSSLSDLSVPAISVIAIAYMLIKTNESREVNTKNFLDALQNMRDEHEIAMKERELALRSLEKEVRTSILEQLSKNSQIMERVINHLDRH